MAQYEDTAQPARETSDRERKTLIVFVRGFRRPRGSAGLRDTVKPEALAYLGTRVEQPPQDLSLAGYAATRFGLVDGATVDIAEVDWEPRVGKLSTQPIISRMLLGLILVCKGLSRAPLVWKSSLGLVLMSLVGFAVILAWLYLTASVLEGLAEKSLDSGAIATLKNVPGAVRNVVYGLHVFFEPRGLVYIAILAFVGILGARGIDGDTFADIADAFERYFNGGTAYGSLLEFRTVLVQQVFDAIGALTANARYDRVVVLGHSFGAIFASEAAARHGPPIELITVGAFFNYLSVVNRTGADKIVSDVVAAKIPWTDFSSPQDYLTRVQVFRVASERFRPRSIPIPRASWSDRLFTQSHLYYFRCPEVNEALFGRRG